MLSGALRAQIAFESWMTRRSLRFASRIAFRCVLHPRENRDIRRWELSLNFFLKDKFKKIVKITLSFFFIIKIKNLIRSKINKNK